MHSRPLLITIVLLLASAAASAEPRWTMVRTDSLTVIGDPPASALKDIAIQLEQFRAVVAGLIHDADRPLALPTVVYAFSTRKAMQPYLPMVSGHAASLAGYFQRDSDLNAIALSLDNFDEASAIAYHEFTHLLVSNAVRSVPVWLNEGLAEYYSTYRLSSDGRQADIGRPPEGRLTLLRERSMLPLSEVIAVDHSSALYNEGNRRSIFYAESWALTHYLLTQMPGGGAAINKYVAEIAEGRAPHEAFFSAFGATTTDFDRLLRVYVQRSLYAGTKFTFSGKLTVGAPGPPRVLSPPESSAWLGDLQRRVGREAEAAPAIDAAVTAGPDLGIAHLASGLLRLSQQRINEGLLELARAAELSPDDFLTQYLQGAWLLRLDLSGVQQVVDVATGALKRAAALKPQSSEAQAWLAYALMQDEDRLADARIAIERAIELAPGRIDYRLRWADIRILQGSYGDARKLLTSVSELRADPRSADAARRRLDRLDEYERAQQPVLRPLNPGERRAAGVLTRIECGPGIVRFRVRTSGVTILAVGTSLDAVDVRSHLRRPLRLECGLRENPDAVYVTWLPDATPSPERDGAIVALEFVSPSNVRRQ